MRLCARCFNRPDLAADPAARQRFARDLIHNGDRGLGIAVIPTAIVETNWRRAVATALDRPENLAADVFSQLAGPPPTRWRRTVAISPAKSRSRVALVDARRWRSLKSGCRIRAYLEPPHEPKPHPICKSISARLWDTIPRNGNSAPRRKAG